MRGRRVGLGWGIGIRLGLVDIRLGGLVDIRLGQFVRLVRWGYLAIRRNALLRPERLDAIPGGLVPVRPVMLGIAADINGARTADGEE